MKLFFGIFILALNLSVALANPAGPCARKLLATGDRVEDTTQFTMYLELLLHERVIVAKDLDLFLSELERGNLINPIPNQSQNKEYALHHSEFQQLIESGSLARESIKMWSDSYLSGVRVVEKQKEVTKAATGELPFLLTSEGAVFYKIKHPVLGEVYKILKPTKQSDGSQEWDEKLWPVYLTRDSMNHIIELQNEGGADIKNSSNWKIKAKEKLKNMLDLMQGYSSLVFDRRYTHLVDPENKNLVSKDSPARRACLDLENGIDLPSAEDYNRLYSYFEKRSSNSSQAESKFTEKGRQEFLRLFPDSEDQRVWSSTADTEDTDLAWTFMSNGNSGKAWRHIFSYPFRCVGRTERPK